MENNKNVSIYSYRLTCFGGAAPCYQENMLSLAICKRDMRRVIGRKFLASGKKDDIWFVGLVGASLAENSCFNANNRFQSGDILYIAKVTDVKTYGEYFSDSKNKRKDKIYIETGTKTEYMSDNKYFIHIPHDEKNPIHEEIWLQDRDWDVAHKQRECYVLISDKYCFVDKKTSEYIQKLFAESGYQFPKGVGHKKYENIGHSTLIHELEKIVVSADDNGICNLLMEFQDITRARACGKETAI